MLRLALTGLLALAAVAVSSVQSKKVPGSERISVTDVTCSTKYVEGGEALTAEQLGLNQVDFALCQIKSSGEGTVNIVRAYYDDDEEKLQLFDETPAEVASEAEIKEPVVRVIAWGS